MSSFANFHTSNTNEAFTCSKYDENLEHIDQKYDYFSSNHQEHQPSCTFSKLDDDLCDLIDEAPGSASDPQPFRPVINVDDPNKEKFFVNPIQDIDTSDDESLQYSSTVDTPEPVGLIEKEYPNPKKLVLYLSRYKTAKKIMSAKKVLPKKSAPVKRKRVSKKSLKPGANKERMMKKMKGLSGARRTGPF